MRTVLLGAALVWIVLVGGTELGSLYTSIRAINAAIAAVVIGLWLWQLPRRADTTDRLVLGALVVFLIACISSDYPRMSYEAATTAVAYTAAFSVTRWELADRRAARALVTILAVCAIGLLLLFVPLWGGVWRDWIAATGTVPPLDLILPVGPYRGHHVVGMLFALLLPALLQLTQRRLANVIGYVGIALSVLVIYMAGSRTVWLALTLGILLPYAVAKVRAGRGMLIALSIGMIAALGLAITGVLSVVIGRLATTSTLDLRLEIWSESLGIWLADPMFGTGPGSFSAAFTFSDYFYLYDRVGRHADNAVVQVLLEAGVLGALTFGLLAAGLISGMRHRRWTRPALMGIGIFGFMSLTDNPSDTANLVIFGVCWAALCTPARMPELLPAWAPSWRTAAIGITALVLAGATGSMLAASAAFDASQAAARSSDEPATIRQLVRAVSLDPGHALYWRELGLHRAAAGDAVSASADLRRALALNPADTTAMRALAVLQARDGDSEGAMALARRAASLRPTHEENLTTLAVVAGMTGENDEATDALTEVLRRFPWAAASPGWSTHFPSGDNLRDLMVAADRVWVSRPEVRTRFAMSQVWLNAILEGDPRPLFGRNGWDVPYLAAEDALLRCDLPGAQAAILQPPPGSPTAADLTAIILVGRAIGDDAAASDAIALGRVRGASLARLAADEPAPISAFWDPEEDRRIYERDAVVPVDLGLELPTAAEGLSAWLRDPHEAAVRGAPGSGLASCEP